jgi:site-specific DNA-methyltransferase (adenine-specific)
VSAPEPYWADPDVTLYLGKCETVLPGLPANSVDAIVTDPPAGASFMNKTWDSDRGGRDQWVAWLTGCMAEALRVLKPGGHALVWALPRTSGWTQWALEDAGFEIRDCISHLFGQGYPKGLDVGKAIDKAAGAQREVIGHTSAGQSSLERVRRVEQGYRGKLTACTPEVIPITAPATADAARWDGWGTALKPGQEMWWLARKPLRGTVAANVLEYGTGALNIAACRVGTTKDVPASPKVQRDNPVYSGIGSLPGRTTDLGFDANTGRWPTNILLTHSAACQVIGTRHLPGDSRSGQESGDRPGGFGDVGADSGSERPNGPLYGAQVVEVYSCAPDCPVGELDRQSGVSTSPSGVVTGGRNAGGIVGTVVAGARRESMSGHGDSGGASRFYPTFRYQAKAPQHERPRLADGTAWPTVKPVDLVRWLVRLITPPGGTVLDCFAGTGVTAEACIVEGFRSVLIEQDPVAAELIRTRLRKDIQPDMFGGAA